MAFPGTIEAGSDEDEDDKDFTVDDTMIEAAHMGDRPRLRKILDAGMSVDLQMQQRTKVDPLR